PAVRSLPRRISRSSTSWRTRTASSPTRCAPRLRLRQTTATPERSVRAPPRRASHGIDSHEVPQVGSRPLRVASVRARRGCAPTTHSTSDGYARPELGGSGKRRRAEVSKLVSNRPDSPLPRLGWLAPLPALTLIAIGCGSTPHPPPADP